MTDPNSAPPNTPVLLVLDDDVVARSAVASYLRECGYTVIEAAREKAAKKMLSSPKFDIDIAICATNDIGSVERFEFTQWVRKQHPAVRVLVATTAERTAKLAADICAEGPHLRKPYEHKNLVDWIKRLRASARG